MPDGLVSALAAVARRQPDAPALASRSARWSYGDLWRAIAAVNSALQACALKEGARVALLLPDSPQYAAAYYGTLAAGCVVVPLNPLERASALSRQIGHCGASLLIGDPAHPEWAALRAASDGARIIETPLVEDPHSLRAFVAALGGEGDEGGERASPFGADPLATIMYTSGTTGRPKGVMLSHRALHSNTAAIIEYLQIGGGDRGLCVLPFHFAYGNSVLHSHLLAGAFLALENGFAFPRMTLQRMQDEAITGLAGVPSTFALLLGRCRLADFDLGALRYITQAGGPMPGALLGKLREQAPGVKIFVMYGQTEATARLTYLPPEQLDAKPGSVGIAIPGVQIEVRCGERPAAPGETGEICARGPNIMLGYWNDAAASAEVLHEGWLRTGDLGHFDDDGFLYIDGRDAEMIKVGAYRVSPQEIEEAIARIEGVEEVAVTGVPDELLGQAIKAVIVARPGEDVRVMDVKAHCRRLLAAYKVPKVVEFATTLPRTASGKVQRFKLAEAPST